MELLVLIGVLLFGGVMLYYLRKERIVLPQEVLLFGSLILVGALLYTFFHLFRTFYGGR